MKLHKNKEEFEQLITIVAKHVGIPEDAIRRDYYIVKIMQNLQNSNFVDMCVFKGGTSLSKCYPGSINRFSEDIALTFIPTNVMSNKQYDKALKSVEDAITHGFQIEKIKEEQSDRNKSSYIWPKFENRDNCQIKLEIESLVRPDPFTNRQMKTYIQEYLELQEMNDIIMEYDLKAVSINTLDITRTFLD